MASHSLAIAKASFSAGMMKPDPTSVPRMDIARFHTVLEALLRQCSPANIELCKDWLLKNAISSVARIVATGKYLVALASSLDKPADGDNASTKNSRPSSRKRQLHILYLLNDLLHHTKYHVESSSAYSTLSNNLKLYIVDLFGAVSTYDPERRSNHHRKVQDLLRLWDQKGYYQPLYINKLREIVASSAVLGGSGASKPANGATEEELVEASTGKKDAPYIMPASHGDPSTPYYDLPAGNLLPHIIPNSTVPIDPQQVKPLQFAARPAEETLMRAVKSFMKDVDSLDMPIGNDQEDIEWDIDEMGQPMFRDEETGDFLRGEGYYGWSKAFCEKMKRRRDRTELIGGSRRSDSMDRRSSSPRKRRRYSPSGSSQRPYSSSRSISRSPRFRSRSRSLSRPRSISYSPPPILSTPQQQQPMPTHRVPPPPPPPSQASSYPSPVPFPPDLARGFPLGPGGLPIPPPPPNYKGPWPPPPPPLPPSGGPFPQSGFYPDFPPFAPPSLSPSVGPRGYSNSSPPPLPNTGTGAESQMPSNSGGWRARQYIEYPTSTGQPQFNGHHASSRGRGDRGDRR